MLLPLPVVILVIVGATLSIIKVLLVGVEIFSFPASSNPFVIVTVAWPSMPRSSGMV